MFFNLEVSFICKYVHTSCLYCTGIYFIYFLHGNELGNIYYISSLSSSLAFRTGNPRVGFSHTIPALPNTVPVAGTTHTRPVNRAVSHGILDTCSYVLLKYCKYMYIKYEKKLNNKEKL